MAEQKRFPSLDILRGIAIGGMVLSGMLPFVGALPAFMYHGQVPPPLHKFNPNVLGITWVDLVFPFFLFTMGVAVPIAFKDKILNTHTLKQIFLRALRLLLFAVLIFQYNPLRLPSMGWWANIVGILMFTSLFALFVKFPEISTKQRNFFKIAGYLGILSLVAWAGFSGKWLRTHENDIIIRVLANVYVLGTILWFASRNNPLLRMGFWLIFAAMYLGSAAPKTGLSVLWNAHDPLNFAMLMLQKYQLIFLVGTLAGDFLLETNSGTTEPKPRSAAFKALAWAFALTITALVATLSRHVDAGFALTIGLLCAFFYVYRKKLDRKWGGFAAVFIVAGYCAEPFQEGIKKDPATLSYFLLTSGLAVLWLWALEKWTNAHPNASRISAVLPLRELGKNPLMAYCLAGFVVVPFLKLTTIDTLFPLLGQGLAVWGTVKGLFITWVTVKITAFFSSQNILWKV
jgi:predicted acyltransferase